MKLRLITLLTVVSLAIASCGTDRKDASEADSNRIDTNDIAKDTSSMGTMPDKTSTDSSMKLPDSAGK